MRGSPVTPQAGPGAPVGGRAGGALGPRTLQRLPGPSPRLPPYRVSPGYAMHSACEWPCGHMSVRSLVLGVRFGLYGACLMLGDSFGEVVVCYVLVW